MNITGVKPIKNNVTLAKQEVKVFQFLSVIGSA
jgi:hypothetical protein